MPRPTCPQHPNGRVRRYGYYGKHDQYQRWQCVPPNGDAHFFRPPLPMRMVGRGQGPNAGPGSCPECQRAWGPGEGLPTVRDHGYTVRDIAATLMRLAEGHSYRGAGQAARRRSAHHNGGSNDGRIARDWVSQYAPVLAAGKVPTEWPEVLVVDKLTFKRRSYTPAGQPIRGGTVAFHVFAALSYGDGSVEEAEKVGRRPRMWRMASDTEATANAWVRFFDALPGAPEYVVCDRDTALAPAIRRKWPDADIFPCTWHLYKNLYGLLVDAKLRDFLPRRILDEKTFTKPKLYGRLIDHVEHLLTDGWTSLTNDEQELLEDIDDWLDDAHDDIDRSLEKKHHPLSTGALEKPLRVEVKNALYDRRHLIKNLDRLDHLLTLMQLRQLGEAEEREWARRLADHIRARQQHQPAPRQQVDSTTRRAL